MGAIHNTSSTLHTGPQKRARKGHKESVDLVDSETETDRNKGSEKKKVMKHEITIKHDRHTETPSTTTIPNPKLMVTTENQDPIDLELTIIDKKIQTIEEIMKTYEADDVELKEFKIKKRLLLLRKFELLNGNTKSSSDTDLSTLLGK